MVSTKPNFKKFLNFHQSINKFKKNIPIIIKEFNELLQNKLIHKICTQLKKKHISAPQKLPPPSGNSSKVQISFANFVLYINGVIHYALLPLKTRL